jgi:phospholipid/cholesterol/gamma-HCH transport system substrate-binding protein
MTRLLRLLVLMLAGALVLSSCSFDVYKLPLPGGADTGNDPLHVTVQFTDVMDLVPQSTVKVADVTVGKVTDIKLKGFSAEVKLEINNDAKLPANAVASIRQTSLLGEKFVSLSAPETGASTEPLADNAVIPLDRSGRNPEVEEVLGALSLLLNGGGVAQLKTISSELNLALEGNEGAARSVLDQISAFMGTLDQHKADVVHAIDAVNALAIRLNKQMPAIDSALEELPGALKSLDRQRDDLVKMLGALEKLGNVGVRVIKASKVSTIAAFHDLQPVLKGLADSGKALPESLQVLLTYPWPDTLISRDPQAARALHMGDYVNLSVLLNVDLLDILKNPAGLPAECVQLNQIPTGGLINLQTLCQGALDAVQNCYQKQTAAACSALPGALINTLCKSAPLPLLCSTTSGGTTGGTTGGTGTPLDQLTTVLQGLGLGRAGPGGTRKPTYAQLMKVYDPALVTLLVPGVTQ